MIYLRIRGRIGNQLFMYATARMIQKLKGNDEQIVIEDHDNLAANYVNSLTEYPLRNVRFVEAMPDDLKKHFRKQWILERFDRRMASVIRNYNRICSFQRFMQPHYQKKGLFCYQDGYIPYPDEWTADTLVDGFFQSEKFFAPIADEIRQTYRLADEINRSGYPNLEQIKSRNTVCISIKVQHNAGNPMYDVCHDDYYAKAIAYIEQHVENPLFFVCSDNVDYVKEHLIDTTKHDVVEQDMSYPVHISLAVMAQCKHFIISNSTFAWWAQYLSDYEDKIVCAPSKWYGIDADWQYDIYQDNWVRIEV